jgi:hypothetical protein
MKYMLLINHGDDPDAVSRLTDDEQKQVAAEYMAINETPGVTPGLWMEPPEKATTVRVKDKKMVTTDGPFAETKEAVGGFDIIECDSLEEAVEIAAAHPAAQVGTIEVRPLWGA